MTTEDIGRTVHAPNGDEFAIDPRVRAGWPLVSDLYDIVFGRLHRRIFGYRIVIKQLPLKFTSPVLYKEKVRRRAVRTRVAELARDIETGAFKPG